MKHNFDVLWKKIARKGEVSIEASQKTKPGLTRPQVKQHIGVSERMQADWESGKSMPTVENVAATG